MKKVVVAIQLGLKAVASASYSASEVGLVSRACRIVEMVINIPGSPIGFT